MTMPDRILGLFAAAAIMSGCGGGGGGSPVLGPAPGNGGQDPVVITSANARAVAVDVFAAFGSLASAGLVSTLLFPFAPFGDLVTSGQFGEIAPYPVACSGSGGVTVDGELANGGTLTPGDRLHAVFADCDDFGAITDGEVTLDVISFDGAISSGYAIDGTVTTNDLRQQMQTGLVSVTTGVLGYQIDFLSQQAQSILTQARQAVEIQAGDDDITYTIRDYTGESSYNYQVNPAVSTADEAATIDSPVLGGRVVVDTPIPYEYLSDNDPDTGPYFGERRITGDNGATITVVILDDVNVQLEIDLDGDGLVDETQDMLWSELAP